MRNKFPGICACGTRVAAGMGDITKRGGRWIVTCEGCSNGAKVVKPALVHDSAIYWLTGMGERACTSEYEDAFCELQNLRREDNPDYETVMRAESRVDALQASGHLGEVTRYAEFSQACADLARWQHAQY